MNEAAIILKRDAGGRVVVAEQQRVDLVRAYERSGLSGPKFAALAGVNYQSFATWLSPATSKCTTCGHFKVHHLRAWMGRLRLELCKEELATGDSGVRWQGKRQTRAA